MSNTSCLVQIQCDVMLAIADPSLKSISRLCSMLDFSMNPFVAMLPLKYPGMP